MYRTHMEWKIYGGEYSSSGIVSATYRKWGIQEVGDTE